MAKKIHSVSRTGRVQTSTTGENFVNLGSDTANDVLIINGSGTVMDVRVNSAIAIPLAVGASLSVSVAASLAEIQVKRNDDSDSQVYLHFVYTEFFNA